MESVGRLGQQGVIVADSHFWQDRRVLVTGCSGILGSWLTLRLLDLGADVVGIVRDWVPHSELVRSGGSERVNLVRGDITDAALIERVFSDYEISTCMHLAAQTAVGIANRSPLPTFESNIRGTWMMLDAARRWPGLEQMVVASSDKAYGAHSELPYSESAELRGNHPYDVSKSCADLIARAYAHTYGLPVAVTRCANMYGGGDLNWNRIVPGTMRSALRGEPPVIRSDGTPRRDYIYVHDVIKAYTTITEALAADPGEHAGRAYNFGKDAPLTALEMVQNILAISDNPELEPIVENAAPNEIQDQYLSSRMAHERLGWRPEHSLLDSLSETFEWYRAFLAQS